MKIRNLLLTWVIIPSGIILLILLILNAVVLNTTKNEWIDRIKIESQITERNSLLSRTNDTSYLTKFVFDPVYRHLQMGKAYINFTEDQTNPSPYGIYYNELPLGSPPPPGILTTTTKDIRPHSVVNSGWFKKGITNGNILAYLADPVNTVQSYWDNYFQALYKEKPEYLNIYFGRESDGHYHTFPYIYTSFSTLTYNIYPTDIPTVGYDPRERIWYVQAKQNSGEIILTPPYNDALTGKVLITLAVWVESTVFGDGVIGIDITLDKISELITGTQFLNSGKYYIIDQNLNAVLYPNVDLDKVKSFLEVEFTSQFDRDTFAPILNTIMINTFSQISYTKNNEKWIMTAFQVQGETPYTVISTVPLSEINAPAESISKDANKNINVLIGVGILFIVILLVILIYVNFRITRNIIAPIEQLIKHMGNIRTGNLGVADVNTSLESLDTQEMIELVGAANSFSKAITMGNDKVYAGKPEQAKTDYLDVLADMKKIKNERGIGVCYNNLAVVCQRLGQYFETSNCPGAVNYYLKAVKNADDLIVSDPDQSEKHILALIGRQMNLGTLYMELIENNVSGLALTKEQIFDHMKQVRQDYISRDHIVGAAIATGHIGNFHAYYNEYQEAEKQISDSLNALQGYFLNNEITDPKLVQAKYYAGLNYATLYNNNGSDFMRSIEWCNWIIGSAVILDQFIYNKVVSLYHDNLVKMGRHQDAHQIQSLLGQMGVDVGGSNSQKKKITFQLDVSGSMSTVDDRNNECRLQLCKNYAKMLVTNYLNSNDLLAFYTFSTNVNKIFDFREIGLPYSQTFKDIMMAIDNQRSGGVTQFYGSLYKALKNLNTQDGIPAYFVMLTDGSDYIGQKGDYASVPDIRMTTSNLINEIIRLLNGHSINLIIITVGQDFKKNGNEHFSNALSNFVNAAKSTEGCIGIHIEASFDQNSIKEAFTKAGNAISGRQLVMESV